jgi:hypothetical protein
MTRIHVRPMPTAQAQAIWNGGLDANGQKPEPSISDGVGVPCRHCLRTVASGKPYLILAYRPFPEPQPYAEVGPIFLCAEPCEPYTTRDEIPAIHRVGEPRIVRGYGANDRIVYGTGKVVPGHDVGDYAGELLDREDVAYVHVRSSMNNCFAFRIDRS